MQKGKAVPGLAVLLKLGMSNFPINAYFPSSFFVIDLIQFFVMKEPLWDLL